MNGIGLARLLGWFSLGLGALQIAAPRLLSDRLGLNGTARLVRGFGFRELAAGLMVLSKPDSPLGPSARVAGDVLDLAVLAAALSPRNEHRRTAGVVTALVLGVTLLDMVCASTLAVGNNRALRTAQRTRIAQA